MIIVMGIPRSGTSVMVEALRKNGYYPGGKRYLIGRKYPSELAFMKDAHIAALSFHGNAWGFYRWDDLVLPLQQSLKAVNQFIIEEGINVVKDNYLPPFYHCWCHLNDDFQNAKVIRTRRNLREASKSMVRLQSSLGRKPRSVNSQLKLNRLYNRVQGDLLQYIDHVEVWHEDMVKEPKKTENEIAEYLGHDFDLSIISQKETWKHNKRAN